MRRIITFMVRALTLRCPNCGGRGLFASWFRMRERCPRCGLVLERHESEDYFIGGMMFNIVLSELLFAGGLVLWLVITWPDPPWDLIEWLGIPLMALAPILLYPVSRTVWLAFDLLLRPVTGDELRPHRTPITHER